MGELYIIGILAIINIFIGFINFMRIFIRKNTGIFFLALTNLLVGIFLGFQTNDYYNNRMTPKKEAEEIECYYEVKTKVDNIKTDSTIVNKSELLYFIEPEVETLNNLIEKHKTRCNSWWEGYRYSEKIGNLEKIRLY